MSLCSVFRGDPSAVRLHRLLAPAEASSPAVANLHTALHYVLCRRPMRLIALLLAVPCCCSAAAERIDFDSDPLEPKPTFPAIPRQPSVAAEAVTLS